MSKILRKQVKKIHEELGINIRMARKAAGIRQIGLADLVGITRQTITAIELGKTEPSFATIYLIALSIGVPLEKILPKKEAVLMAAIDGRKKI